MIAPFGREAFEISDDVAYLNTAFLPPLLKSVAVAGEAALVRRAAPWKIAPGDFFTETEKARSLFAGLIKGEASQVALIPSVSYGLAIAAANLTSEKNSRVLLLDGEFPSNYYVWEEWARRNGAEITVVKRPSNWDWTGAILASLDSSVKVLSLPVCHWTDGSLLDLQKISQAARENGSRLVLDGSQAIGAFPFDVSKVDPDFLVTVGYKWLLGPYAMGLMYVANRNLGGAPIEWNWLNRKGCEDFARLCEYTPEFQPGARRFDVGEKSNFILLPMLNTALETLHYWGINTISDACGEITRQIEKESLSRGWEPVAASLRVPHIVGLRRPGADLKQLQKRLAENQIYVSVRGDSIRVSPHIHVTSSDLDRLFSQLS